MDLSPEIISALGGGATVSSVGLWMIKRWISKLDARLDKQDAILQQLLLKDAKDEGKFDLIWREINTDKVKISKLQASEEKQWETISNMAQPRISDILKNTLKEKP